MGTSRFGEAPSRAGPLLHRVRAPEGCSVEHRRLVVREIAADRSDWRRSEPAGERARVELVKHRPLRGRCFTELAPETGARLNHWAT